MVILQVESHSMRCFSVLNILANSSSASFPSSSLGKPANNRQPGSQVHTYTITLSSIGQSASQATRNSPSLIELFPSPTSST